MTLDIRHPHLSFNRVSNKTILMGGMIAPLFDHLGGGEQRRRNCKAERFGGGEIDNKLELGGLIDREIAGLRPAQNFVHIVCRVSEPFRVARSVG